MATAAERRSPAISLCLAAVAAARKTFAGQPGFEAPYRSDVLAGGELGEIVAAGYPLVAGAFGVHRFHHVAQDDARCISPASVAIAATAFRQLLDAVARGDAIRSG